MIIQGIVGVGLFGSVPDSNTQTGPLSFYWSGATFITLSMCPYAKKVQLTSNRLQGWIY